VSLDINAIISSGLLELYVAGLTSDEETRQVEDWVVRYPAVLTEIRAIEMAVEAHAQANAVQPPPHVKDRLMAAIAGQTSASEGTTLRAVAGGSGQKQVWKWMAAASVALLLVSAYIGYTLYGKNKQYAGQLAAAQKTIDSAQAAAQGELQRQLLYHHDIETLLMDGATTIALNKTDKAPDGCMAKVFWNKADGTVYIDPCLMPKAPPGKTYQLWAIVNGKPVDAGLVKTSTPREKYSIQKMKEFKQAEAFAVTLEKAGGSPTPTLEETYVAGKV
jgi:anti-sigma-K factor RskA